MKNLQYFLFLSYLLYATNFQAQVILNALEGSFQATKTTSISQSFTRNNCGTNARGTSVTYTATATGYATSTISQQEADRLALIDAQQKARQDISRNGQDYANRNGNCQIISYSATKTTSISQSFTRNNCTDAKGTSVTYTATATGYATSTISQQEADRLALANAEQKAREDINRNGQDYANRNGGCIPYSKIIIEADGYWSACENGNIKYPVTVVFPYVPGGIDALNSSTVFGKMVEALWNIHRPHCSDIGQQNPFVNGPTFVNRKVRYE